MIFISAAEDDLVVPYLTKILMSQAIPFISAIYGETSLHTPKVTWDIKKNELFIGTRRIHATGAFIRNSTVSIKGRKEGMQYAKAENWYLFFRSWVCANPHIKQFNSSLAFQHTAKTHILALAVQCGLEIADTYISNHYAFFNTLEQDNYIIKPLMGGSHTQILSDIPEISRQNDWQVPAILQEKLISPDLRIYRIDNQWVAFEIYSDNIDYRVNNDVSIKEVPAPPHLIKGLRTLTDHIGMDYTAADFKRHPDGHYCFLEVNTSPMFEYFDHVSGGKISNAIITYLSAI